MKITKLTSKQIDSLPVYRDKWLKIGLSTDEVNRDKAQQAISNAYKVVDLKPPTKWIWLPSPLHGAIGSYVLSNSIVLHFSQFV